MKVEEVNDQALYLVDEHVAIEVVGGLTDAQLEAVEVAPALGKLLCREVHDGVEKQRQLPSSAVVALRRAEFDKLCRDVNHLDAEVRRGIHLLDEFAFAHNHEVALAHPKSFAIE